MKTYKLRGELALALGSNRTEFVTVMQNQLEKNPMTLEEQREILELVKDLIADREAAKQRLDVFKQRVVDSLQNIRGATDAVERRIEEHDVAEREQE